LRYTDVITSLYQ